MTGTAEPVNVVVDAVVDAAVVAGVDVAGVVAADVVEVIVDVAVGGAGEAVVGAESEPQPAASSVSATAIDVMVRVFGCLPAVMLSSCVCLSVTPAAEKVS